MCLKARHSIPNLPTEEITTNQVDTDIAWNDNCSYTDYDDYITLDKQNTDLTVLQLNIRGLINKQTELRSLLEREYANKVDVALLCETWVRLENINRVNITGYVFESKERKGKRGGGVGIFVREST